MRKRVNFKKVLNRVSFLLFTVIVASSILGVIYGGWTDRVEILGSAKMAHWKPRLEIRKTLDGTFTDAVTGETRTEPSPYIAIATSFPSLFKMTIEVRNTGSVPIYDIVVIDVIENTVGPSDISVTQGFYTVVSDGKKNEGWDGVHFDFNEITWTAGVLQPGEEAMMTVWISTLMNPSGKYEPTSGDEGDRQDVEINRGAECIGICFLGELRCETEGIIIWIIDDGVEDNKIGVIDTPLPYVTPWSVDFY